MRAEIASDGTLQRLQGQVLADEGTIVDRDGDNVINLKIDRADIRFTWDARQRALVIPFQIQSAGNQFTLRAALEAPADQNGVWLFSMARDDPVIDPIILAAAGKIDDEALPSTGWRCARASTRFTSASISIRATSAASIRGRRTMSPLAVTGSLDYSGAEPHLAFGVRGDAHADVGDEAHVADISPPSMCASGSRATCPAASSSACVIAGNAPLPEFKASGPPMPDEGLSVDIETSGTTLRPVENLPAIRDADLTVRITGSTANVSLGRGTVEVTPGRKLSIASGVFEIPNTHLKAAAGAHALPHRRRRCRRRPRCWRATRCVTVSASRSIRRRAAAPSPPKSPSTCCSGGWRRRITRPISITADLTNFAADKMLMGQKVEAPSLRVSASSDGYQISGDVKINGTPATIDLSKKKGDSGADLHLQAMIDEAARRRLGIDFGGAVTGTIPIKVATRIGGDGKDPPMTVDADLTPVKIDNLLPGWVKAAGRPVHANYTMTKIGQSVRFDDLTIVGSGVNVRGSVELDDASEIVSANFPVFSLSDGDKVSLKADRASDGVLRVAMRGDVFDGANFVKSSLAGVTPEKSKQKQSDIDLDIKLGTVLGHNGETLRGLDLKLLRRGGRIRNFTMSAKIGRDTPLNGDLRVRSRDNHQVIYFETDDAGALFRFTDMYPRMFGGQMWVAMDPPTPDHSPQLGTVFIRNFVVRGEPGLERAVAGAPGQMPGGVQFSEAHCEFTKVPGRMAVRDGVVRGPVVGATIEGQIDYVKDDMHLRGTFVPFYGLNNMFGQLPIVGLIPRRRQQRGPARHHLRGGRSAERAAHHGQSGDRDCAGAVAQIHPERRTRSIAISSRRRAERAPHAGFSKTLLLFPSVSLMTPSDVMSFSPITCLSSGDARVVHGRPPSLAMARRTSPFERQVRRLRRQLSTPSPAAMSLARHRNGRQRKRGRAFLESLARGARRLHRPRRGHAPARSPRWRAPSWRR